MEYVVSVVDRLYEGRAVYLWFFVSNRVIFWRLLPDDVGDDSWTQIGSHNAILLLVGWS